MNFHKLTLCLLFIAFFHSNVSSQNCNNWLKVGVRPSFVSIGDLDISGSQITVEAMITRTAPYSGGDLWAGDVVAKHKNQLDANYLLRPGSAEITTSNGYYITPPVCSIELNKTYHIAMVYNGTSLKFYRNGYLMSQVFATGNLIQNDWPTQLGLYYINVDNEQFIGFINEVRIWNIARSQADLKAFMNTSLPSPSTQTGLQAYYVFDNLLNKQGNSNWNATLGNGASVNETNPSCALFQVDSCCVVPNGRLSASTICSGVNGSLTFTSTQGTGPFKVDYTDGVTSFSQMNVQSGTPFPVSPSPNVNTKYTLVSVTDLSGCNRTTGFDGPSAAMTVHLKPTIVVSPVNLVCYGDSAQLNVSGGQTYQWSPTTGLNNFSIGNPKASPQTSTPYKVVVSTSFGCTDSTTIVVPVTARPNVNGPHTICQADSAQLLASGANQYHWYPSYGLNNNKVANPKAAPSITTKYKVVTINNQGCIDSAFVSITVNQKPSIQISPSKNICKGDTTTLAATGGIAYKWFPNQYLNGNAASTILAFPPATATYKVSVLNDKGCYDTASVDIYVQEKPNLSLGVDTTICKGQSLKLDATIAGAENYRWSDGSSTQQIKVTTKGMYAVAVNVVGCSTPVYDTVMVFTKDLPKVYLPGDTTHCNYSTLFLSVEGENVDSYLWNTGSTDSFTIANTSGNYTVQATNSCGIFEAFTNVSLKVCSDDLYFPNAFSPNFDGKNDKFKAVYLNGYNVFEYELKVFNRWGEVVFETKNPSGGWDGRYKGKVQGNDVFVWTANYRKSVDGTIISKNGTVMLIR